MRILLIIIFLLSKLFAEQTNFKISYDSNYAPFCYKQNNTETGLFIDIWKLWAKHNNYKIEFVNGGLWEDALNLVKEGKVDFFLGTNPYEDWMISSNSFYETKSSLFSLAKNSYSLETNTQLKIGIIGNDHKNFLLKNLPFSKIISFKDYKELLEALKNEEIDFLYDDKIAIEYYSVQNNFFHLIKQNNNLILQTKIHAISYSEEKRKIFDDGFLKIPINELLELENKWILNATDRYYPDFKQQINLTKEEQEFIRNTEIKVSISNSWEPFTFKSKNNEALGISSEYWKLISNKLNIESKNIFFKTFNEQLASIKDLTSDLIYSTGDTPQKKEYAIFSKEYAKFPISIVTKKDENFIENISMIKDKKIAIGNNFTAHNILKNEFPNMDFFLVNSIKEGLETVSNGKAYAFIDIQPVLYFNISKYDFNDLKVSGNTGLNFSLKFMIRNDYPILESILNKAISSISVNELNLILHKWDNIQFQTSFNYDLFWKILIAVSLITLAFISRSYTLKKVNKNLEAQIKEKTKELYEINQNLENLVKKKTKELIHKENILNHQSKMAAMGEMIENIAHQWRQPLSVISTVATGAKLKKELDILTNEEFYETMDTINNSSQHLSNTIDAFRNFFSKEKEISPFDINDPIEKVLYLLKSKLSNRDIKVIKNSEEATILGYENEFIQVILNIINNSLDAFEDKKENEKLIFINIYKKENSVIISIKDNAGGIKNDVINRIFEPYFTTKHQSQGTGIGLYMSLEIIEKHMNGTLSCSNKEFVYNDIKYKGAIFIIELPVKK
jgi:signal transduction histidine kinase